MECKIADGFAEPSASLKLQGVSRNQEPVHSVPANRFREVYYEGLKMRRGAVMRFTPSVQGQ